MILKIIVSSTFGSCKYVNRNLKEQCTRRFSKVSFPNFHIKLPNATKDTNKMYKATLQETRTSIWGNLTVAYDYKDRIRSQVINWKSKLLLWQKFESLSHIFAHLNAISPPQYCPCLTMTLSCVTIITCSPSWCDFPQTFNHIKPS